ncbi:MAG: hypothetical protein GY754_01775 [bacterium]|nr:hypothetical protein [bacterium]
MTQVFKKIFLLSLSFFLILSCRKNLRDSPGNWKPGEITAAIEKMTGAMSGFLKDEWKKPAVIEFVAFRNRTTQHITQNKIINELKTACSTRGIIFSGKEKPSPVFYLNGDIRELDGKYFFITIRLIHCETGVISFHERSRFIYNQTGSMGVSGSSGWGFKETMDTAEKMSLSLRDYYREKKKKPAYITLKKIRNRTAEQLNTRILMDEIEYRLLKNGFQLIDNSLTEKTIEDMKAGKVAIGQLKSPFHYLYGSIRDNIRLVNGKKTQYIICTMKLKNLMSGSMSWTHMTQFLKKPLTGGAKF